MSKKISFTKTKTIFAALSIMLLSNCASSVSMEQMRAETASYQLPKLPEKDSALVYVVRPSVAGGLIRFNVFLDDKEEASEMGFTRASQYIYFKVKPGQHKVFSKAENWADLELNAESGKTYFIQQNVELGIVMARNSLNLLDEIQGKYKVKNSKIGMIKKSEK